MLHPWPSVRFRPVSAGFQKQPVLSQLEPDGGGQIKLPGKSKQVEPGEFNRQHETKKKRTDESLRHSLNPAEWPPRTDPWPPSMSLQTFMKPVLPLLEMLTFFSPFALTGPPRETMCVCVGVCVYPTASYSLSPLL